MTKKNLLLDKYVRICFYGSASDSQLPQKAFPVRMFTLLNLIILFETKSIFVASFEVLLNSRNNYNPMIYPGIRSVDLCLEVL